MCCCTVVQCCCGCTHIKTGIIIWAVVDIVINVVFGGANIGVGNFAGVWCIIMLVMDILLAIGRIGFRLIVATLTSGLLRDCRSPYGEHLSHDILASVYDDSHRRTVYHVVGHSNLGNRKFSRTMTISDQC